MCTGLPNMLHTIQANVAARRPEPVVAARRWSHRRTDRMGGMSVDRPHGALAARRQELSHVARQGRSNRHLLPESAADEPTHLVCRILGSTERLPGRLPDIAIGRALHRHSETDGKGE